MLNLQGTCVEYDPDKKEDENDDSEEKKSNEVEDLNVSRQDCMRHECVEEREAFYAHFSKKVCG